jgi:hypothetical protein
MSILTRIVNVFRKRRLEREIDEELADHIDEAVRAIKPFASACWPLDRSFSRWWR